MTWAQVVAAIEVAGSTAALEIPADWLQGRTAFGGLQAALALRAMRTLVPATPLRTLQGTFLAPVPAGRAVATARLLRTGKNASHVEARILDGDNTAALLVGVFGTARPSKVSVAPKPLPQRLNPKAIPFRYVPDVVPAFTQHFEARWLQGWPPYTGDTELEHILQLSMRESGPCSESHVLAMADFIPPVALSHLSAPAAGATLTWMIEMLADRLDAWPLADWRVEAVLAAARDGYTSQSVTLWAPDHAPVARSTQSMVVFG